MFSVQNDPSSVRIGRSNVKVGPEPTTPARGPKLDLGSSAVFGVALERLREDGQLASGVPLVLRQMVEFLDRNGNRDVLMQSAHTQYFVIVALCFCQHHSYQQYVDLQLLSITIMHFLKL